MIRVLGRQAGRTALCVVAIASVLQMTACSTWSLPRSQSRGHLFDDIARGGPLIGGWDIGHILEFQLRRDFPPGTPLTDLMSRIRGVDVTCSDAQPERPNSDRLKTECKYESLGYQAVVIMIFDEPTLNAMDHNWTLTIDHRDGVIEGYKIAGLTTFEYLGRSEYRARANAQNEAEKRQLDEQEQ